MAAPASPGSRPPLRVAGLALLAIGIIAAIIGLFTMATGGGNGTVAQAPLSSERVEPTADVVAPPTEGTVVAPPPDAGTTSPGASAPFVPDDGEGATGATPAPPVAAAPGGAGAAGGAPDGSGANGGGSATGVRAPVRVYNNSTIQGLAAKASADFRDAGWTVTEIGGYQGLIPRSTVYYRPGTAEEAAAKELAAAFRLRAEPRFAGIAESSPGLIVIVTKEYASPGK